MKYRVQFKTGAFTSVEVEADSVEEARELADAAFHAPFICHQCSRQDGDRYLELGDDWEQDESDHGAWVVEP
jgi:hypothetical protein